MNKTFLLLALLLSPLLVVAQQPISHDVNFPTGDAAWTVQIERLQKVPAESGPKSVPEPREIDVVRKGNVRRDTIAWSDGSTSQYWWKLSPGMVLFRVKPSEPLFFMLPSQLGNRRYDASNFSWVNAKTYRKEGSADGQAVREYHIKIKDPELDRVKIFNAEISAATGLPVTWSDDDWKATFQFKAVPAETLTIPSEYQAEFDRIVQSQAPARPLGKR